MTALSPYESAANTLKMLLPELILLAAAIGMMTVGVFVRAPRRAWSIAAASAIGVSLIALLAIQGVEFDPYAGVAVNDDLAFYGRLVFLLGGLVLLGMAHDQVDEGRAPEFFGMLLMIHAGAMLVTTANEIVFLFVGLELVSIPTYLLLYLARRTESTQEAATKYFYLSIFSSGLLLFGLAYLYGLTGVGNLKALAFIAANPGASLSVPHADLALVALVFILAGLGFRVAAVPFHFYAPDVYQGSPAVLAATLAWVPKALGFVAILRALGGLIAATGPANPLNQKATLIVAILAMATMTLGNTVALAQNNLKRLLAYSSIAHAGYLLIGVAVAFRNGAFDPESMGSATSGSGGVAHWPLGGEALLYYLVAYAAMTLGAFAILVAVNGGDRRVETVDDLAGLAVRERGLALEMAICLFSLAGIPPLAGFVGKLQLFASAWGASRDDDSGLFQLLTVVGAINSAIGAYYYLRIVVVMFLRPAPNKPISVNVPWPTAIAISACTLLSVVLGLFATPVLRASRDSAIAAAVAAPYPGVGAPAARVGSTR